MSSSDSKFAVMDREKRRIVTGVTGKQTFPSASQAKTLKENIEQSQYNGSLEVVKITPFDY